MKLSQLFSNEQHTDNTRIQSNSVKQAAQWSRQIRSLVPGQTISGEIVGRSGNEVQIKLAEDMVLNARVDKNINIELGQNMTFEVKNNGSTLTLSPLFTNVATDVNVLKALEMAGLAVNETNVSMTEQMMAAGLPVNKNMLQQILRELNSFPGADIADVVNLHKLQMPVNETNVAQMASYRNLTHQLSGGLEDVLNALPKVLDSLAEKGDVAGAAKLYQELFLLVQEGEASTVVDTSGQAEIRDGAIQVSSAANGAGNLSDEDINQMPKLSGAEAGATAEKLQNAVLYNTNSNGSQGAHTGVQTVVADIVDGNLQEMMQEVASNRNAQGEISPEGGVNPQDTTIQTTSSAIPETVRTTISGEILNLVENLQISGQDATSIREQAVQFAQGRSSVGQLFSVLQNLTESVNGSPEAMSVLQKVFSGKEFRGLLSNQLKNMWTIAPDEVAEAGKVEELYHRLDKQLKSLANALETVGQTETAAFKAVNNMNQNLDFLNQINQMYAYVQLPLRLQQGEAHGELYVYTNKRKLSRQDGAISALLHLDMEHLGPVDVYVTMQSSKVNTQFYVRDDEMLDFLEAHMDLLTKRLQKKGYDCSFSMTSRSDGDEAEGGIETILRQEKGIVLSQYAFDVRT